MTSEFLLGVAGAGVIGALLARRWRNQRAVEARVLDEIRMVDARLVAQWLKLEASIAKQAAPGEVSANCLLKKSAALPKEVVDISAELETLAARLHGLQNHYELVAHKVLPVLSAAGAADRVYKSMTNLAGEWGRTEKERAGAQIDNILNSPKLKHAVPITFGPAEIEALIALAPDDRDWLAYVWAIGLLNPCTLWEAQLLSTAMDRESAVAAVEDVILKLVVARLRGEPVRSMKVMDDVPTESDLRMLLDLISKPLRDMVLIQVIAEGDSPLVHRLGIVLGSVKRSNPSFTLPRPSERIALESEAEPSP